MKRNLIFLVIVSCTCNYACAKPKFEGWSLPLVTPFTQETNYMSIFGYLRYRFLSSQQSEEAAQAFPSVTGTTWSTFINVSGTGKTEDTRYVFREKGQVEIYSSSNYFKNNKLSRNFNRKMGSYFWEQRGNMLFIRGSYTYPPEVLQPGERAEFGVEYIGLISEEPLNSGMTEGIQLAGLMRYMGSHPQGWLATKQSP